DFVVYRITGYRAKHAERVLLPGAALQHDLGQLIETVSESLDLRAADHAEPVLAIDDVTEKFNVTSKTIQRWRRKGLPARRFVFPDGKRRVGFLLSSVDRVKRRKVRLIDDALYHQDDAAEVIDAIVAQEEIGLSASAEETRVPRDLPPYLQALYRTPLLTPARERALFLKFNFHKFQF